MTETRAARFAPGSLAAAAAGDLDAERDRLAYLARVTETMIGTLDTGESATRLAELAVSRLCDWAIVVVGPEDGRAGEEGRAHRDPARRARRRHLPRRPAAGDPAGQPDRHRLAHRAAGAAGADRRRSGSSPTLPTDEVRAAWRRLDTTSAVVVPSARPRRDVRRPGPDEQRRPAAAHRPGDRHGGGGRPARRTGTGQRPPLRAQLAVAETLQRSLLHPADARGPPAAARSRCATGRRRGTRRSAATGTTPSPNPMAPPHWSSVTSWGTTSRRRRR